MPSPNVPYIFTAGTVISSIKMNANFAHLQSVLLNLDTSNTVVGFGAAGHGDLSTLTTIFHSDSSIQINSPKYTSTTIHAMLTEIATAMGYSTGSAIGFMKCWGTTYHGREIDFATGTYYSGGAAPAGTFTESFNGNVGVFSSVPYIITFHQYNPPTAAGGGPPINTQGLTCFALSSVSSAIFQSYMTGTNGDSAGWLRWIAIGA